MIKLLRVVRSELYKLFRKKSTVFCMLLVLAVAVLIPVVCAAVQQNDEFELPAAFLDGNAGRVFAGDEIAEEGLDGELPGEELLLSTDRIEGFVNQSGSDFSVSEIISGSDSARAEENDLISGSDMPEESSGWRELYYERLLELQEEVGQLEVTAKVESGMTSAAASTKAQEDIREALVLSWCLKNDRPRTTEASWYAVILSLWLCLLPIGLCAASACGQTIAGELRCGTIRTLVPLPATRVKMYLGKLAAVNILSLLMLVIAWVGALIGGAIAYGGLATDGLYVGVLGSTAYSCPWLVHTCAVLLCCAGTMLVFTSICGCISAFTRSVGATVGLGGAVLLVSLMLGKFLGMLGSPLLGASIFVNLDLSVIITDIPNFAAANYAAALISSFAHYVVFTVAGYAALRKDVV